MDKLFSTEIEHLEDLKEEIAAKMEDIERFNEKVSARKDNIEKMAEKLLVGLELKDAELLGEKVIKAQALEAKFVKELKEIAGDDLKRVSKELYIARTPAAKINVHQTSTGMGLKKTLVLDIAKNI